MRRLASIFTVVIAGLVLAGSAAAQKSDPGRSGASKPDSSRSGASKSKVLEPGTGKGSSHKGGHYMTLPPGSSIRPPALRVPMPGTGKSATSATAAPSTAAPSTSGAVKRNGKGKIARSEEARRAFEKQTGFPKGRPGYVIDHIVPLACGGADKPGNMQWQTTAEAKAKDKVERKGCGRP